MDDLISEYGFTAIVIIIGACVIKGFAFLLSALWNGGLFL